LHFQLSLIILSIQDAVEINTFEKNFFLSQIFSRRQIIRCKNKLLRIDITCKRKEKKRKEKKRKEKLFPTWKERIIE
jgi:hypothetical protein